MPEAIFRSVPPEKVLPYNMPRSMRHVFVLKNLAINADGENSVFEQSVQWCEENFPRHHPNQRTRWTLDRHYFYRIFIRDEIDAVAFKLRWC